MVTAFPSTKRLGSRYGRKVKYRLGKIESQKKGQCPYCHKSGVKRLFVGVWHCRKCNSKFTAGAYTVSKLSREVTP